MLATKEMLFLIVDDQQTMRRLLKSSLRQLDYKNFKEAENVLEALGILKSAPIDFVILDWSMPGEPGISLLKQIKASEEWQKNSGFNGNVRKRPGDYHGSYQSQG